MADEKEVDIETAEEDRFAKRVSIDLTPNNSHFYSSEGGLVSLDLDNEGKKETFERVALVRAFPITNPREFISVKAPSSERKESGVEIGMIRRLDDFDEETQKIIGLELERRYFIPEITRIISVKEKYGYQYYDSITTAGEITFVINNPNSNFRTLDDGSVLITDMDGNCFMIPEPRKLDRASYKKIQIYI